MANGWNDERRKRQSELIQRWQPWKQSTGPITAAGKAASAQNVAVGQRKRQKELEQARADLAAAQAKIRRLTRKKDQTAWERLVLALDS